MCPSIQKEFQTVLEQVVEDVTGRIAGVQLRKQETELSEDLCTVYTTFDGGYHACLVLCAETALLTRLTQHFMQEENVAFEDIEDFAKEYFNVICGQVVAGLYQNTHIASRFGIPSFCTGKYLPEEECGVWCALCYTSDCKEGALWIHQVCQMGTVS